MDESQDIGMKDKITKHLHNYTSLSAPSELLPAIERKHRIRNRGRYDTKENKWTAQRERHRQ